MKARTGAVSTTDRQPGRDVFKRLLDMMKHIAISVVAGLSLAGCQPGPGTAPNATAVSSQQVFTPPEIGTVWTYARGNRSETFERIADATRNGQTYVVYRSTYAGRTLINYFLPETGSWFVSTDATGKEVASAKPQNYQLDWPLVPGKEWAARFTLDEYDSDTVAPRDISWLVVREETASLPIGPTRVVRIEGTAKDGARTNVFAPRLGVYVIQETLRPDGSVRFRRTLTDYDPPAKPNTGGY